MLCSSSEECNAKDNFWETTCKHNQVYTVDLMVAKRINNYTNVSSCDWKNDIKTMAQRFAVLLKTTNAPFVPQKDTTRIWPHIPFHKDRPVFVLAAQAFGRSGIIHVSVQCFPRFPKKVKERWEQFSFKKITVMILGRHCHSISCVFLKKV